MFYALNSNHERIHIDHINPEATYFCPVCGGRVVPKNIEEKDRHFTHCCGLYGCEDKWGYDMSAENAHMKSCFAPENQEVILEFAHRKHQADVVIGKTVINYMDKPLTAREFYARTSFFINAGYRLVWIFNITTDIQNHNIIKDTKAKEEHRYIWQFPMTAMPFLPVPQYQSKEVMYCFYISDENTDDDSFKVIPIVWSHKKGTGDDKPWQFVMNPDYKITLNSDMDTDRFFWDRDQWANYIDFSEDRYV